MNQKIAGDRDASRDGWKNRLKFWVLTHGKPIWMLIQAIPPLRRFVNGVLIDSAILTTKTRPYALSTRSDYTSWDSLTDRTFSGRHLPPVLRDERTLPKLEDLEDVFRRPAGAMRVSDKSTLLFSHFAQWFTDGFLRTDREDPRKNTSHHDIDLSPLYGRRPEVAKALRTFQGGRLKSQQIQGGEFPPYYYGPDGAAHPDYAGIAEMVIFPPELPRERLQTLFALGTERANVSIGYVMLNTLFLREHNRIAGVLAASYPLWDDERIFQTARNILIVMLIKIVVEEYINHITPYHFKFRLDAPVNGAKRWYRTNWMSVEFNLLYRWHSLTPDEILCPDGVKIPTMQATWNNQLLTDFELGAWFEAATRQPAGEIGLLNTASFLVDRGVERAGLRLGRSVALATYNDYRAEVGFPRVTRFEQISSHPDVIAMLKTLYATVDDIEYVVGLFAEDTRPNSPLGALTGRLVGIDALSQALTNPLLSENVYNPATFSPQGLDMIAKTRCLADIVARNTSPPATANATRTVAMTQTDWKRR